MRRLVIALSGVGLLCGSLLLATAPIASAAPNYPPGQLMLSSSTCVITPGQPCSTTVSGAGCKAGPSVSIDLHPPTVQLATVTADSSGNFTTTVTIPAGTTASQYTITSTCTGANGKPLVLGAFFSLTSSVTPTTGTGGGGTPFTGSNVLLPISLGILLLGAGSVGIFYARRRPSTAAKD